MSEKKSINLIVIAVITTAIMASQYSIFYSMGIDLAIDIAAEDINIGTLLFFVFSLISVIIMAIALLLVAVELLLETDKINVVKINGFLILITVIIFLIEVLAATLNFLGII